MKLYVFLQDGEIIAQVRAENHDQAMAITGLGFWTDFYSTDAA